jgi:hypothetical protein
MQMHDIVGGECKLALEKVIRLDMGGSSSSIPPLCVPLCIRLPRKNIASNPRSRAPPLRVKIDSKQTEKLFAKLHFFHSIERQKEAKS